MFYQSLIFLNPQASYIKPEGEWEIEDNSIIYVTLIIIIILSILALIENLGGGGIF
jgi:hypothetical protein